MEKAVYLLWRRDDEDGGAFADRIRDDLTEWVVPIVRGVQANVADIEVAGAVMRMATMDTQPDAVVGIWADSLVAFRRAPIEDALAGLAGRIEGYQVVESEPIVNSAHPVALGERTPGLANIAMLRRPAGMDHATWLDRWQTDHTQPAIDLQQTFGYVQNVVVRALTPVESPVDGIVEELFPAPAIADFTQFFDQSDGEDAVMERMAAMGASVHRFGADTNLDLVPTGRYILSTPFA